MIRSPILFACLQAWLLLDYISAFAPRLIMVMVIPSSLSSRHNLFAKEPNVNNDGESPENDDNINVKTTIKINDGGSDLTDRFKYKVGENNFYINAEIAQNKISNFAPHLSQVNALMGVFDPQGEDTNQQNGNILNAMLSFPVNYKIGRAHV